MGTNSPSRRWWLFSSLAIFGRHCASAQPVGPTAGAGANYAAVGAMHACTDAWTACSSPTLVLSNPLVPNTPIYVFVGGLRLAYGLDYTVANNVITIGAATVAALPWPQVVLVDYYTR